MQNPFPSSKKTKLIKDFIVFQIILKSEISHTYLDAFLLSNCVKVNWYSEIIIVKMHAYFR